MKIIKEHLAIKFEFDSKEEQEFWEEEFYSRARGIKSCGVSQDSFQRKTIENINKDIEECKEQLIVLGKAKSREELAHDGVNKLINIKEGE